MERDDNTEIVWAVNEHLTWARFEFAWDDRYVEKVTSTINQTLLIEISQPLKPALVLHMY